MTTQDATDHFESKFREAIRNGKQIEAIKIWREWKNEPFKPSVKYVLDNWIELRTKYCKGD